MSKKRLFSLAVLVVSLISFISFSSSLWATNAKKPIKDLYHKYEVWTKKGIKFVVRDETGHYVTWGIGKLESWNGTRTVLCVRDKKGRFLTWAKGKIENWKNNKKRYVFRDKKGHFIQWSPLDFTSKATFSKNLNRLTKISLKDVKHGKLLIEVIYETIISEMKNGEYSKAFKFLTYGFKVANDETQKLKLMMVMDPIMKYIKSCRLNSDNEQLQELYTNYNDLYQMTL